ncbi:hypothetical protein [uncultured Robinsoniella sp.]|uniref:hypothetical protein n=1 Tax=uncultured Robinsoniella sp. TaxID=904190 RepID=UPI00374FBD3E
MDEKVLIEEVIRELKRKIGQDFMKKDTGRSAMVLGVLPQSEEKALKAAYQIVPFSESESCDIYVLAQLPIKLMADLVLGIPSEPQAACILRALLEGKRVYLLESGLEYRRYKETAYKTLYHLYQEYEAAVKRYGIELISYTSEIAKENRIKPRPEAEDFVDLSSLRLLRESDLIKVRGTGSITVLLGQNTIITPLARDYIANHNLAVIRN